MKAVLHTNEIVNIPGFRYNYNCLKIMIQKNPNLDLAIKNNKKKYITWGDINLEKTRQLYTQKGD